MRSRMLQDVLRSCREIPLPVLLFGPGLYVTTHGGSEKQDPPYAGGPTAETGLHGCEPIPV